MAIQVAVLNSRVMNNREDGVLMSRAKLSVTGLAGSSANTIPHGLPRAPLEVIIVPNAAGGSHETQAADGTNIYITQDAAITTVLLYVEY